MAVEEDTSDEDSLNSPVKESTQYSEKEQHGQGEQHAEDYPPGCFVVSVYQGSWYVGEVRAKEGKAGVEKGDKYLLVSFMTKFHDNSFK